MFVLGLSNAHGHGSRRAYQRMTQPMEGKPQGPRATHCHPQLTADVGEGEPHIVRPSPSKKNHSADPRPDC